MKVIVEVETLRTLRLIKGLSRTGEVWYSRGDRHWLITRATGLYHARNLGQGGGQAAHSDPEGLLALLTGMA